jgi:Xaa-Pro aminopeptidase
MKNNDIFATRLAQLQSQLLPHQAWLIATPSHITYLTNFQFLVPEEKEALLIISSQQCFLIHASFCPIDQVTSAVSRLTQTQGAAFKQHLVNLTRDLPQLTEWYLDENILSIEEYKILQSFTNLTLKTLNHQSIWQARMIKDEQEQAMSRKAGQIAHQAWEKLTKLITEGMTELQIKILLDNLMFDLGADKPAFPTIVAFQNHSALPHHQPGKNTLTNDSVILTDFGATVQGYRSDMTRTFWFGDNPSEEFLKIEKLVKQAYQRALEKLRAGSLLASDLDYAAREVINQAGFGKEFIHTTGHGVGLDIHEPPSLHWKNSTEIQPGMVITIEPGIYITGQFGYRYENTILVTPTGALELTT